MKKIFTLIAMLAGTMSAMAVDYTDEMSILLNGLGPYVSTSTVSVDEVKGTDGEYNITLKEFSFSGMPIGDVTIKNVKGNDDSDGSTWFEAEQDADITNGAEIAAALGGKVHVTIKEGSRIKDGKLYLVISLPVPLMGGIDVDATFGTGGYQIPNSGFENFHTATYKTYTSDEPNAWHSFMSATGSLVMAVSTNTHTFISDDIRPNSLGSKSVKIVSGIVLGFQPANGTITTGQLKAGGYSATSTDNNSFLDFTNEATDGNDDPFYVKFNGIPDGIEAWMKYKQGVIADNNKDYKYATISAIITDGTYYQDPEPADAGYKNVVAKANNSKIESNGFEWQKVSAAFDYDSFESNGAETKALLVTISTNAQPGVASTSADEPDQLFVDDIALVYNSKLESLKVKGSDVQGFSKDVMDYEMSLDGDLSVDDIEAVSDGRGAYVRKAIETVDGGVKVTITVISNDWKDTNVYTLNIKGATSGLDKVVTSEANGGVAVYNINGQRTYSTAQKGIYIIRKADGKTVKVIKK